MHLQITSSTLRPAGPRPALASASAGVAFVALLAPVAAEAAIYGGPTYSSTTATGYRSPGLPVAPGRTAGDGVGVGYAEKRDSGTFKGVRAVRWDAATRAATELGDLGTSGAGYTASQAYALNGAGTAAGYADKYESSSYKGERAVRWDAATGAATELGDLGTSGAGYTTSRAYALNDAGTAAGEARKYESGNDKGVRAVRWDAAAGAATELGNLGADGSGVTYSFAFALNDAGTAAGVADKYESGTFRGTCAVRWDASTGAATELGNLGADSAGNTYSRAYALNDAGTAAGIADKYESGSFKGARAVRWDASGAAATELGNLGTSGAGYTTSLAYAVNDAGTAVGYADKYVSGSFKGLRAVRWDASTGAATELGDLGTSGAGVTSSLAYALNDAGIAVGSARDYDEAGTLLGNRAVAWGLDGVAIDLNTLLSPADAALWTLTEARGISDGGWITGIGTFDPDGAGGDNAYNRLFLLDASHLVPEPASLALLALGGLLLARRR